MTARLIIETRLGRDLGPLATMPPDLRRALYLLGLQLVQANTGHRRRLGRGPYIWTPHREGRACNQ